MTVEHWVERAPSLVRTARYVLRADPYMSELLPRDAKQLDHLLSSLSASDTLKDDRTTTVAKLTVDNHALILKRYNPRNHWHKIKRALRKSRARRCWEMSFEFKRCGLNVSPPLMMLEDRCALIRMNAYFANRLLVGDELLTALPKMCEAERKKVKEAVFQAFETLESARISHGDMKATNLLWVNGELFFIDLDAARKHEKWSFTWRKSHIKDRRRFLKNWENQPDVLALFSALTV